jgi:hypothetical protein
MIDPTSPQRGRPTKIRQQLSENNLRTESNIWSQVPEWARYPDILTDRQLQRDFDFDMEEPVISLI